NETPLVSDQTFSVTENAASGTEVGTIVAIDPDGDQDLIYAIEAGNIGNAFTIDPTTGLITVANAGALDFESTSTFVLSVSVTNGGSAASSATLTATIQLNDENEAPQVAPRSFTLNENSSNGTVVGTIQGTDPDAGQSLLYAIESGNINDAFSIDP